MLNLKQEEKRNLNLGAGKWIGNFFSDFLKEIEERLNKMEEILVVDRIEGDFAVCENRNNKKIKNIPLSELPQEIKEGTILVESGGKYSIERSGKIESEIHKKMQEAWGENEK